MTKISRSWQIFGFLPPLKRILPPRCPPQKKLVPPLSTIRNQTIHSTRLPRMDGSTYCLRLSQIVTL